MYTVLIVDDELLIRKRIRLGLAWEQYGYRVQGEAGSADEALRMVEERPPDLALIDIAMPGKNGVELVHELRQRGYLFEIIMLTGHKSFDYAKQALYDGVFSYLLKPMHEEEMVETLCRLREILDSRKRSESDVQALRAAQERAQVNARVLRLLRHGGPEHAKEAQAHENGTSGHDVQESNSGALPAALTGRYSVAVLRAVAPVEESTVRAICGVDEAVYVLHNTLDAREILCIIPHGGAYRAESTRLALLQTLALRLEQAGCAAHAALSGEHTAPAQLMAAYGQAQEVLRNRMLFSPPLVSHGALEPYLARRFLFPVARQHAFGLLLRCGDEKACHAFLVELFAQLTAAGAPYSAWRDVLTLLLVQLGQAAEDAGCPQHEGPQLYAEVLLAQASCVAELAQALEEHIFPFASDKAREPRQAICMRVKQYIMAHYQEPELSLSVLSEKLQLTPSYVSRLFKKEEGVPLVGYITQVRMEAARELLLQGLQVRVVARRVGYTDEYYFSRCFKKQFGSSANFIKNLSNIN